MELSKKDKKVARQIIDKGLQREFENGLKTADIVLQNWKNKDMECKETYYQLYKQITSFDKHIAQRYDGLKGSTYLLTIISQMLDNLIREEDIVDFSDEVQLYLKQMILRYQL
jgi:hypothetical protein